MENRKRSAFTLIELLVAMSILIIIIQIIGMFFQRASVAWDTGSRRVELLLTGRAVADFMAQEMQQALPSSDFDANGAMADFWILGDAMGALRATQKVHYAATAGKATRTAGGVTAELSEGVTALDFSEGDPGEFGLPLWVDIKVTVSNEVDVKTFQTRATFPNRARERM